MRYVAIHLTTKTRQVEATWDRELDREVLDGGDIYNLPDAHYRFSVDDREQEVTRGQFFAALFADAPHEWRLQERTRKRAAHLIKGEAVRGYEP